MTTETSNTVTPVIRMGSEFGGGKVVGIQSRGVLTIKGDFTRFYPKEEVEQALARKRDKNESVAR
jgi:hypothetical protein